MEKTVKIANNFDEQMFVEHKNKGFLLVLWANYEWDGESFE